MFYFGNREILKQFGITTLCKKIYFLIYESFNSWEYKIAITSLINLLFLNWFGIKKYIIIYYEV